jgi:hypothetical protein
MHLAESERQNIKEVGPPLGRSCTCFSISLCIGGGCRARIYKRERRKQLNVHIYIIFNLNEIEFLK